MASKGNIGAEKESKLAAVRMPCNGAVHTMRTPLACMQGVGPSVDALKLDDSMQNSAAGNNADDEDDEVIDLVRFPRPYAQHFCRCSCSRCRV
jgi:hypothetical protein